MEALKISGLGSRKGQSHNILNSGDSYSATYTMRNPRRARSFFIEKNVLILSGQEMLGQTAFGGRVVILPAPVPVSMSVETVEKPKQSS